MPSPGSDAAAQLQLRWVSVSTGVILVAVRWYLRYPLSYREVEELLAERGIEVDYVTIYCWVQRFTPLLSTQPGRASTLQVIVGLWMRPQGCRSLGLSVPGDRPARLGH